MVDNAFHLMKLYHWIAQLFSLMLFHGIVIYPVNYTIQLLNNWHEATEM